MNTAKQHPTGIAGLITSVVILVLLRFHVELTPEEVATLGGVVTVLASALSPRNV
jgi:hypothetical protein